MLWEAEDEHFAWMLGGPAPEGGLRLPAGGVDAPQILAIIRRMAAAMRASCGAGCWMIVVDGEVVGLCSFKAPPDQAGSIEIGYGVAPGCRQRGHATRAIAQLLALAAKNGAIRAAVAETASENLASQRVLERNGFTRDGERFDHEDGEIVRWRRDISDFRLAE